MEPPVIRLAKTITCICLMLLLASSCTGADYTTQHFSYPPGSKPHESNWQYTALVIVSSNKSPITKKSKKYVKIKVYDKYKTNLLTDEFEVISASITANVVWDKFDELNIELFEEGNEFADDSYNKSLVSYGPKKLLNKFYRYNLTDRKYTVVNK
jgi:hypothetical protein